MKKLIAILFVMLIVPSIGYTTEEWKPIPADRVISRFEVPNVQLAIRLVCIDGHKFVYLNDIQFDKRRGKREYNCKLYCADVWRERWEIITS